MSLASVLTRAKAEPENWRYTNVAKLLERDRTSSLDGGRTSATPSATTLPSVIADIAQRHQLVFIDGIYSAEQSALPDLPAGLLRENGDTYHLEVGGQTCLVTTPIELVFLTTGAEAECATTLTVTLGANTRLTLIEHHIGAAAGSHIVDLRFDLQTQAKLVHGKLLHGQPQMAHLANTHVTVAQGGSYRNFALIKNTKLVRNEIEVRLADQLAQCSLDGVMLLQGHEHADTTTRIIHAAPHGTSGQLYKSVLKDQSRGVFQGRVKVCPGAQKTDATQLNRALLLSDQAEMDAKPELTIDADDVKCSHGCTIGELDTEAMFYLRARGIPAREARALLLRGFVFDVIAEIEVDEWRAYALQQAEDWLHEHA